MRKLAFAAVAVSAFALDGLATNTVVELPPVVVEASRLGQTSANIAASVDVIDRRSAEASGARSTVDALEKAANVFVRRPAGSPALSQVSMRGYGANGFGRVKIIVDGEELNNPDMSAQDLLRVPFEAVRRIEVMHGPQTVLHGSEASSGVINIITGNEGYDERTCLEAHGGNLGRAGVHVGHSGGAEEDALTYFGDFDYDRSDGWRENSWYEMWSAKGGIKKLFENGSWLSVRTYYANSGYGLPGGLMSHPSPWRDRARDADAGYEETKARNDVYGVFFGGEGEIDDENLVTSEFSFRNRKSSSYNYLEYDVYDFVGKFAFENTANVLSHENQLNLGTDFKYDILNVDSFNVGQWGPSGGENDYSRYSAAIFARDEMWMIDTLSFFGGARGEWFCSRCITDMRQSLGTERTDSSIKGDVAGEAGLIWRPVDAMKVFAKWSRFYHAPMADEMFSAYGLPNLSLKPECGHNAEMGIDWRFAGDFEFAFTGFHTELEDEILYQKYANVNSGDRTSRTGLDTSLRWGCEKVGSAGVLYGYVWARFAEGEFKDNDIPIVPRQRLRTFGEVYLLEWLAISGGFRFVGRQRYEGDFANEGGYIPAYSLVDVGIRVEPVWRPLKGLIFSVTVDNLLDRRYYDYGSYLGYGNYIYPACGRSFVFSVRYEF